MALTRRSPSPDTAAGAGKGSRLAGLIGQFFHPAAVAGGAETRIGTCNVCDEACGLRVLVREDVITLLERLTGERGICEKADESVRLIYHPHRLKYPLKRDGAGWLRITWEEALDTIAARRGEPFKVIMAVMPGEAVAQADMLLPAATPLETSVIAPLFEARPVAWVNAELRRRGVDAPVELEAV